MRILITGAGGMLGQELPPLLTPRHQVFPLGHSDCDITDAAAVCRVFSESKPELVIHCAAYSDVDGCERDPARAMAVNAHGAEHVARAAEQAGARVFYISTDYIFDGNKRSPYMEQDPPHPISCYGESKLAGERATHQVNGKVTPHLVIRTSWLYGLHRANFVDRVIEQAQAGQPVKAVADQVSCLTWTYHLAQRIAELVEKPVTGIVHLAGGGECSRYEIACYIVSKLAQSVEVAPTDWGKIKAPARRPAYSAMTSTRLTELGLRPLPHWKAALDEYLRLRSDK